jgi:hypothetical protein
MWWLATIFFPPKSDFDRKQATPGSIQDGNRETLNACALSQGTSLGLGTLCPVSPGGTPSFPQNPNFPAGAAVAIVQDTA